jgi:hypothetical protein
LSRFCATADSRVVLFSPTQVSRDVDALAVTRPRSAIDGRFDHRISYDGVIKEMRRSEMRVRRLSGLFLLTLSGGVSPAWAFLDPPYVTPANPVAGDLISVDIYGGECDLLDYGIVWPPPVTRQGNAITILFTGVHEGDPEWCYYSVGTATAPVGRYPAGSYTLDVERRYGTPSGTWAQETLGIVPFTVAGAPPAQPISTPTLSTTGLAGLLLVMIIAGARALRQRTSQLH